MAKEENNFSSSLGKKGEEIAAAFAWDLKRARLRNAESIESNARLTIAYVQSIAGMRHVLCNIDSVSLWVSFDLEDDPDPNGIC